MWLQGKHYSAGNWAIQAIRIFIIRRGFISIL